MNNLIHEIEPPNEQYFIIKLPDKEQQIAYYYTKSKWVTIFNSNPDDRTGIYLDKLPEETIWKSIEKI